MIRRHQGTYLSSELQILKDYTYMPYDILEMLKILKWSDCPRCGRVYRLNPTKICKCGAILVTRPHIGKKSSDVEDVELL